MEGTYLSLLNQADLTIIRGGRGYVSPGFRKKYTWQYVLDGNYEAALLAVEYDQRI